MWMIKSVWNPTVPSRGAVDEIREEQRIVGLLEIFLHGGMQKIVSRVDKNNSLQRKYENKMLRACWENTLLCF